MAVIDYDIYDKGEIQERDGVATLRMKVRARCSSLDDGYYELRIGMPQFQRWQPHPNQPGFYVQEFEARQQNNPYFQDCIVTFTNAQIKDPLEIPAVIGEVKTFKLDGATILDYQNRPILNTAGEPFEPFNKPEQIVVYPIIRNIPDLQDWLFDFESCINDDAVRIGSRMCEPKTLLINSIQISAINDQGDKPYRTCTVEVWKRKSKWLEFFPSRGFNEIADIPSPFLNKETGKPDSVAKGKRPILIAGQVPDKPQFLDKDGKWIKDPTPEQIVMLTAQLYPAIPFNAFPLK